MISDALVAERGTTGLLVESLTVRFGGLVAVDDVSLRAPRGAVTGLIGPNGAGKSTTFNACTGLISPASGAVHLDGRSLDGRAPARRAQLGLGRTFQRMELFDSLNVRENVALGLEARLAGQRWWGRLAGTRAERAHCLREAEAALDFCEIAHLASQTVGALSTGHRRLVEIARALASDFRFLLLDEPSSGLDVHETEQFARILRGTVEQRGLGILLVEHDMDLIRAVCSYIYVLDFGKLIYEGPAGDVLSSPVVRDAYLGMAEVS